MQRVHSVDKSPQMSADINVIKGQISDKTFSSAAEWIKCMMAMTWKESAGSVDTRRRLYVWICCRSSSPGDVEGLLKVEMI